MKREICIHKKLQKSEICQSLPARFSNLEAGPIQMDRADGEDRKDREASKDKNRFLEFFVYKATRSLPLPLSISEVAAGFPSPAEEYMDDALDLNQLLISHPAATFFVRVSGESMLDAHIHPGDVLVVDRALESKHRDIVIAILNGEFTVKRILKKGKQIFLAPENKSYPPIEVSEEEDFQVWGVVTYVIHKAQ